MKILKLLLALLRWLLGRDSIPIKVDSISVAIFSPDSVSYFNGKLVEDDIVGAAIGLLGSLTQVIKPRKVLISMENLPSADAMQKAQDAGLGLLFYNLEADIPISELLSREAAGLALAHKFGMLFGFAPRIMVLENHYVEITQHTDVIYIQAQRYQPKPNFENLIKSMVNKCKEANPDVRIGIQVSVHPMQWRDIPVNKVVEHIGIAAKYAESVGIFYAPGQVIPGSWEKAKQVIARIR